MREILFKNLTSSNLRKKDTLLREVFEKDGIVAKTERRCFYFIKDVLPMDGESSLQKWLDSQNGPGAPSKRHFHIIKEHNEILGEDKVVCKIVGTFYAVFNNTVYCIGFLHAFKVCFMRTSLAN